MGLVARGNRAEVAVVGSVAVDGVPMARDSIFRLAWITKPITAATVMMLVDDGRIALDSPVGRWLPELAEPMWSARGARRTDVIERGAQPVLVSLQGIAGLAGTARTAPWSGEPGQAQQGVRVFFAVDRPGRGHRRQERLP